MRTLLALIGSCLVFVLLSGMGVSQSGQTQADPSVSATSSTTPPSLTPTPAPTSASIAGWRTYTNSALGFAIDYPPVMQVERFRSIANDIRGIDPIRRCTYENHNSSLAICFYLPQEKIAGGTDVPNYQNPAKAALSVNTSNLDAPDCLAFIDQPFASQALITQRAINALQFSILTMRQVYLDQFIQIRYRIIANNTCLELSETSTETPKATSEPDQDSQYHFVQDIFDQMISTFRLMPPVYLTDAPASTNANTSSPIATTSMNMAQWQTYTNTRFGFAISYPDTMQLIGYKEVAEHDGFEAMSLCDYGDGNTSLIICFYLPRETYPDTTNTAYRGASLAISTSNLDKPDCLSYSDWQFATPEALKTISIHDISFSRYKWSAGGGGHWGQLNINRAFHKICFQVTITITGDSFTEYLPTSTPGATPIPVPDYQNVDALFDQVLSTFRFTDSDQPTASHP